MSETNEQVAPVEGESVETTANLNEQESTQETQETRTRTSMETFIQVWEETVAGLKNGTLTGSGVQLVADRLGIKKDSVSQRATKFRTEYGVALSNMPRGGGSRFDAQAANDLLKQIRERLATQEGEKTEADAEG